MKLGIVKSSPSTKDMKGRIGSEATNDKPGLYLSIDALDRLAENIDGSVKMSVKQQNKSKSMKGNSKVIKTSLSSTKQTATPPKKVVRSSLRRLLKSPSPLPRPQRSPSARYITMKSKPVSLYMVKAQESFKYALSDKAESDKSGNKNDLENFQTGVMVPIVHTTSHASTLPTLMPPIEDESDECPVRKVKPTSKQNHPGSVDSNAKKELSFSRADSSDDSGCFSNLSRQSTSLHAEAYTSREHIDKEGPREACSSEICKDNRRTHGSPSMCNSCGYEVPNRDGGFCKNCMNRIKKESDQRGTLEEFRAYAQSIAQSVKKILTINPQRGKGEEVVEDGPKRSKVRKEVKTTKDGSKKSHPDAVLHRYRTEIPMTQPDEPRAKSLLNRSVSFDGNIMVGLDGNEGKSPTYWISNELKKKVSNSSTTLFDSRMLDDDALSRAVVKRNDQSSGDMKGRMLFTTDDGYSKTEKGERIRRKINMRSKGPGKGEKEKFLVDGLDSDYRYSVEGTASVDNRPPPAAWRSDDEFKTLVPSSSNSKQRSRVERAKTDGDLRPNLLPQDVEDQTSEKIEQKRVVVLNRSGSKTLRKADSEINDYDRYANKYDKDKVNSLKMSRLRVMKEGSPVDPPSSAAKNKVEDSKARKTALIRSATAPYKHHGPKKETFQNDKAAPSESNIKANKANARLPMRANKASTLRKEGSMKEREKPAPVVAIPLPPEVSKDGSKTFIKQSSKRRSTSYDGNMGYSRPADLQRSKSRSALNDDKEGRQRRDSISEASNSKKQIRESEGMTSLSSPQIAPKFKQGTGNFQDTVVKPVPQQRIEKFVDAIRRETVEPTSSTIFFDQTKETDSVTGLSQPRAAVGVEKVPSRSSYYNGLYYNNELKEQLSPLMECEAPHAVEPLSHVKPTNHTESYFYCADNPVISSLSLQDKLIGPKQSAVSPSFKVGVEDEVYQDQLKKYAPRREVQEETDALWYTPRQDLCVIDHGLLPRDRSHESKSSTSFHIVANVKSSHSDVSLMKHQSMMDHFGPRKQSIYSESDVDTGVIYHFAKRQTTRAHVPPYHELTIGASKGIYTMSGDVSTSESSNSAISIKSELSDSLYTGGFFKSDPFYDNDTKGNSSSESSSSHIYFEPEGVTKQEPSENDIYTGGVFSSSQNALTLGDQADTDSPHHAYEAMQDGSTNNSTRLPVGRMSRRFRYNRPRIDVIGVRGIGSAGECIVKTAIPIDGIQFSNCSNNSNYWVDLKGLDQNSLSCPRNAVTMSEESLYTDYEPGTRPEFEVKKCEKYMPGPDFARYECYDASGNPGFFLSSPPKMTVREDVWYRGPYDVSYHPTDVQSANRANRPHSLVHTLWRQDDDDDYTTVCPKFRDANNCSDLSCSPHNSNNNHFEECYTGYTGSYGSSTATPHMYAGGNTPRPTATGSVNDQSSSRYSSNTFYDSSYTGSQSSPNVYEDSGATYASSNVRSPSTPAYSHSSTYLYEQGNENASHWGEYDPKPSTSSSNLYEDDYKPKLVHSPPRSAEKDSYFQYVSNRSPGNCAYLEERDSYMEDDNELSGQVNTSPIIKEIKRVGGIVCRENVANKEDYAEDVNRDLEPAAWVPFYRRGDEEMKHPAEMSGGRTTKSEVFGAVDMTGPDRFNPVRNVEDSAYAHNRIYDNLGARNKWREMANSRREPAPQPTRSLSDSRRTQSIVDHHPKKNEYSSKNGWMPPDQIPERARGKRVANTAPPPTPTVLETTSNAHENSTGNSFTDYVKKWLWK